MIFPAKYHIKAVLAEDLVSHRIGTRVGADHYGEFYDTVTGNTFTPRGNNYIRLDAIDGYHNLFNPGSYDAARSELALGQMQNNGYNITRVFLDTRVLGGALTVPGVDPAYMTNLLDFMRRARAHGIYVIITTEWLPSNYYYFVWSLPPTPHAEGGGVNTIFMSQRYVVAYKEMMIDLVEYIKNTDSSLLSTIFSWDPWNEGRFESNVEPFSMTSGLVTPAEGGTYDMASTTSRQLAADNSAKYWVNQMTEGIKSMDPNVLVETSVFTPKAVGRDGFDGVAPTNSEHPDPRSPFRPTALYDSNLDLIDIHQYPLGTSYDLTLDLNSAEIGLLGKDKPRLVGEFGALKYSYPNLDQAAAMLRSHLAAICNFGFKGALFWTWDTDEQTALWNALAGGGKINNAISPNSYPNPCVGPLVVTKSVDKITAQTGGILTYTLNYSNGSTNPYTNVRFEDFIPNGTTYVTGSASSGGTFDGTKVIWNLGTLAAGGSGTVTFQVRIN